jgi:hypothetical protein
MNPLDLYRAIFGRRSIRKYQPTPLPDLQLARITASLSELVPLAPEVSAELHLVERSDLRGLLQVDAPHWVAAFSSPGPGAWENVGFMLEQLVLALNAEGIGCCWQGWPKPTHELRSDRASGFVIALAFGAPREELRRAPAQFKRKPIHRIRTAVGFDDLIEPARLAPYGTSESWFFTGSRELLHVHCPRPRLLTPAAVARMNQLNAGIALSHSWVAARYLGCSVELSVLEDGRSLAPEGFEYVATMRVERGGAPG